jgi:hypothetical protein
VGNHRLDEELAQNTGNVLNLNLLGGAGLNPLPSLSPGLVEGEEAGLASTLDQLIGLSDELGAGDEEPRVGDLSLVEDILDGLVFGEVEGGETRRGVVCGGRRERSRLNDRSAGEVVVEDGLAVGLEDRFGGHGDGVCVDVWKEDWGGGRRQGRKRSRTRK